jgi:hypothetical protein
MDPEKIEQRIVSGKGILKASLAKRYKLLWYDFQVIRAPKQDYQNNNWNPPRSKYAFVCLCIGDAVLDILAIEFKSQRKYLLSSITEQNLYAIKCAHLSLQESIADMMQQLRLDNQFVLGTRARRLEAWQYSNIYPDTCKIHCYADSALQVSLWGIPFDSCPDDQNVPPPPPPPQPPPQRYNPGTPVPVSPPYSGPDDGGDTDPYPLDKNQPPPGPQFPYPDPGYPYYIYFDVDISNDQGLSTSYRGRAPTYHHIPLSGDLVGYEITQIQPPYYPDQKIVWRTSNGGYFIWAYPDDCGEAGLPYPVGSGWRYSNVRNIEIKDS